MAFHSISTLRIGSRIMDLSVPRVMGIINTTNDSFHQGSRATDVSTALTLAAEMVNEGVDLLDIGGASSRPGSKAPSVQDEIDAVVPAISAIRSLHPKIPISIDTNRSEVASAALDAGADLVNDITAGTNDAAMLPLVAARKVPFIIMHMKGEPATMQDAPSYNDVVSEVTSYLWDRIKACKEIGITDLIIDPGFGFGKNDAHNFRLMKHLEQLQLIGFPVLVGVSRKGMIQRALGVDASAALNGTTALHMHALGKGAQFLRVHDVREAKECIAMHQHIQGL